MRCISTAIALAAMITAGQSVVAAPENMPSYVPNQLIIRVTPGTTGDALNAAIDKLGAKLIRPIALANTYLVELLPTRGMSVESAVSRASGVQDIVKATPNLCAYPTAIPNDPYWNSQWGMRMIHAPDAWDIEKGKSSIIVAVIDSGVSTTHPDLQGRLLPGRDVADGDDDVTPSPTDPMAGHGTHVAGIIGAQGNNNIGVVGVCWDNVKILPIKAAPNVDPRGYYGFTITTIIDGLDWAMTHGAQVVNMSLGWDPAQGGSSYLHEKIQELYANGIILVASSGNGRPVGQGGPGGPVCYPAAYDECIAVSALNENEYVTSYSSTGPEVDIAAPGGESTTSYNGDIMSTYYDAASQNTYRAEEGTSMACPHVAGAAALLLSAGVTPTHVTGKLYRSARVPKWLGTTTPLDQNLYGHGILDLRAALMSSEINITQPTDAEVLDTTTPTFKFSSSLIVKDSIKVYLDYVDANKDGLPDDPTQNLVLDGSRLNDDPTHIQYDAENGVVTFIWPLNGQSPLLPGTHTLCVTADPLPDADSGTVKDWTVFFVQPKLIPMGRHLISIPYPVSSDITPYELFGNDNFRLARYIPNRLNGAYATINYIDQNGQKQDDPEAWPLFNSGVRPEGASQDTPPAGLGFWFDSTTDTPVTIAGQTNATDAYTIKLTRGGSGWNLIGDPFPFPVAWECVKVRYQGQTLTLRDAITAEWIRPALYSYTTSGYTFETPPSAMLMPWQGYWVRILPDKDDRPLDEMTLIIPPLDSHITKGRSAAVSAKSSDGWSMRMVASAGGAVDANNKLGVSSRSADGFDMQDVEKPPMIDKYVDLSFVHRDWSKNSGRYASDVRSGVGTGKSWDFEVNTDMANSDVTVSWPDITSIPKNCNAILEDTASGSRIFMRTRAAYTYNAGPNPGPRQFRVVVEPADGNRLLLTNVAVSRTKGSTVSISYAVSRDARVEVRLRDANNRVIRALGGNTTRAAGLNSAHWDGTRDDGSPVTTGLYLAEIVATSQDGEVAKAIRPILIGR